MQLSATYRQQVVYLLVSAKKKKNKGEGVTFTSEMKLCCIFKADVISRKIMLRQEFSCK